MIDSIIAVHGAGGAGGRRHAAHAGERVWLVAMSGPGGGGWLSLQASVSNIQGETKRSDETI